jgi:hypothetical protein
VIVATAHPHHLEFVSWCTYTLTELFDQAMTCGLKRPSAQVASLIVTAQQRNKGVMTLKEQLIHILSVDD